MSMFAQQIDLSPFCDPQANRYALGKPWQLEDGRAMATDSRAAVLLDDGSAYEQPSGRVPRASDIEPLMKREVALWVAPPVVEGPPPEANTRWQVRTVCDKCRGHSGPFEVECDECFGDGECSRCGAECTRCRGDGTMKIDWCPECGGDFEHLESVGRRIATVQQRRIDTRYLWAIARLPSPELAVDDLDPDTPLLFRFDGGQGLVMPCVSGH